MDKIFRKRIYTFRKFMQDFRWLRQNSRRVRSARQFKYVDRPFSERIKLAVTAVNECRYCMTIHADLARAEGVSEADINSLLDKNIDNVVSDYEKRAIGYAYHYAEMAGDADESRSDDLYSFYGKDVADEIMVHIRMICFANLSANTVDAFLNRLTGRKPPRSSLIFEFFFFLMIWPQITIKRYSAKRRVVHSAEKKYSSRLKHEGRS